MTSSERPADEAGMTLIEIIIVVTLLGIIIVPVTAAMFFGLVNSNGTRDRIADAVSAQLVSTYFPSDVQSADEVFHTGSGTCGAALEAGDSVVLRLRWSDPAGPITTVLYFTRPVPDALELRRAACTTGQPVRSTLLVHHLAGTSAVAVTCSGVTPCPSRPAAVAIAVNAYNPRSAAESYDPLEFSLEAKRRTHT